MLEAAMLGVPYTGRVPTFSPSAPADPAALAQRSLRREQDEAFEESLAADRWGRGGVSGWVVWARPWTGQLSGPGSNGRRSSVRSTCQVCRHLPARSARPLWLPRPFRRAKQESAQEAARAAEEAAATQAAAEAAEAAKRDAAARALAALLERKAGALPAEPKAGEPATLQLVVRLPDGTRCGRRFRHGDSLSCAFDFVDVRAAGGGADAGGSANGSGGGASGGGGGGHGGEGGLRPGSYRLVTQFPRRAFEEGQGGTFAEAGLTSDTAAFVELL